MSKQNSPLVLGTERISKLLTQYAIPAIIAMTASSLYNMADSIFIGHGVGPLAISGLALTFPLMNLAAALGSLVGVGASTLVSVKLGQKDYEGANKVLGNVLVLNVVLGLAFTLVFMLLLDPILYFFGASENTISYARDYMNVILIGNVITHMYLGLNAVLRSSGFPKLAMYATLASVVINCVLNPLFIFGFGWGIKGSAWATVISQVISLTGQLIHFSRPKELLHFKKGIYRLKSEIVKGILYIGMSPFLMNLCACLIVILINRGLKEHGGDMAIGAYGIVNRVVFLFLLLTMVIPTEVTIVPLFIVMRKLGWINNLLSLIIPRAATAVGIFYMRQYISACPTELLEQARIDGCREFGIFTRIVLPVISPALASWGAISLIARWNDFILPKIFLRAPDKQTLMVSISLLPVSEGLSTPWPVIMAGVAIATLPLIVAFVALQRYDIADIMAGANKG